MLSALKVLYLDMGCNFLGPSAMPLRKKVERKSLARASRANRLQRCRSAFGQRANQDDRSVSARFKYDEPNPESVGIPLARVGQRLRATEWLVT